MSDITDDWDDDSIAADYMPLILQFEKHLELKHGSDSLDETGRVLLELVVSASRRISNKLDEKMKLLKKIEADSKAFEDFYTRISENLRRLEASLFNGGGLRIITNDFDTTSVRRELNRQKLSNATTATDIDDCYSVLRELRRQKSSNTTTTTTEDFDTTSAHRDLKRQKLSNTTTSESNHTNL